MRDRLRLLIKRDSGFDAYTKLFRTAYEMVMTPSMPHSHFEVLVKCQRENGVRLIQGRSNNKAGKFSLIIKSVLKDVKSRQIYFLLYYEYHCCRSPTSVVSWKKELKYKTKFNILSMAIFLSKHCFSPSFNISTYRNVFLSINYENFYFHTNLAPRLHYFYIA